MISVAEARAALLALAQPVDIERVPLQKAAGRVLAEPQYARRTQPPFAASAMDGYAVIAAEVEPGAMFQVIGEAPAGRQWHGHVGPGQAVRIFTGAPVPDGADRVIIQEDVERRDALITVTGTPGASTNIRPAGGDFREGRDMGAPRRLRPADIALLASMNIPEVPVSKQPEVALISTGDELVMPGETPRPDQIIASNTFGLAAMLQHLGARSRILPIAADTAPSLNEALRLAASADLIITIGGASVGDYDIVSDVAAERGLDQSFYKVAMRPGKPLMAGRLGGKPMIGLPGNPVSAMVCGHVFVKPVIQRMLGLPDNAEPRKTAHLSAPLPANGPREHYMRAQVTEDGRIAAFDRQDSSLLTVLAKANALLIRPPYAAASPTGALVDYLPI